MILSRASAAIAPATWNFRPTPSAGAFPARIAANPPNWPQPARPTTPGAWAGHGWESPRPLVSLAAGLTEAYLIRQEPAHSGIGEAKTVPTTQTNASSGLTNAPEAPSGGLAQVVTNDFGIMPFKLEKMPGSSLVYVTGIISNLSDRQRFGVKVSFGLLDTNDNGIGSATDYQSVLDPRVEWRFRAMVMESKAASARFNSIAEEQ